MTYTSIICEDLHFLRSQYMLFSTFRCVSAFIVSVSMTRLTNRFPIQAILLTGITAYLMMFIIMFNAHTLTDFYLAGFIGGIGTGIVSVSTLSFIIQQSFELNINSIQGIVFSSSGLFGIFFNPILSRIVDHSGWRTGYRLITLFVAVLGLTACLILAAAFRQKQTPAASAGRKNAQKVSYAAYERLEIVHILAIAFITGTGAGILYINAAPILISYGYDTVYATGIAASILSFANLFGKIFMGRLYDRFAVKHMEFLTYGIFFASVLLCALLSSGTLFGSLIVLLVFAISIAASTVGHPALTASIFHEEKRKNILFYATSVQLVGSALGTTLFQIGYSEQHGYLFSLIYEGVLSLVCIFLVWHLYRIHERHL